MRVPVLFSIALVLASGGRQPTGSECIAEDATIRLTPDARPDPKLDAYRERVSQERAARQKMLKHQIEWHLDRSKDAKTPAARKQSLDQVAEARKGLKGIDKADITALFPTQLDVGEIGAIGTDCLMPTRIVDDREAVAVLRVIILGNGGNENDEVLTPVVIRGISTEGWTTDRYRSVDGLFRVTGTQQVATRNGAKSLFVLEPFELPKTK